MKQIFAGFPFRTIVAGFASLFFVFCGLSWYAIHIAPQSSSQAEKVLNKFYADSQKHDYADARKYFTHDLEEQITAPQLAERWKKFEVLNGPITHWVASGGGHIRGGVNLWPRTVSFDTFVLGTRNERGRVLTRLVPEGKSWRIDQFEIYP